jgi:uncharacterized protein (TIGR03083 family)
MTDQLPALRASVERLRTIVEPLDESRLTASAYPTAWTVADVLSHLGSGGFIQQARLDAALEGRDLADDFPQPVWDEWNAKSPGAKAADALVVDRMLLDRLDSLTDDERARFRVSLGPIELDLAGFVGLRVNEHSLHTWDIEVTFDPKAVIPPEQAGAVVDNLGLIVRFAGKPTGVARDLHVTTVDPAREFTLSIGESSVSLEPCAAAHAPDLELPAEAFVRLVYGRLDPDHTPRVSGSADLDELRRVFPGI